MLPGFCGHLVSEACLEAIADGPPDVRRELINWRVRWAEAGPASTPLAILQALATPLLLALRFESPMHTEPVATSVAATVRAHGHPIALVVVPWGEPFDAFWRVAVTQAIRRSAGWCLLFNGTALGVVDAARLYARRHAEFDLELAIGDPRTFAALWRTLNASALGAAASDERSLHALVTASDRHALTVCRSLRDGVLTASGRVLGALVARRRSPSDAVLHGTFEQALTIVYRILFLLFAEARALVPLWHPVYRESYSIEALRDIAERPQRAPGLWDALRAIGRLAHAGCHAGDLRVTPFNGRLFAPSRTPLAERRDLDDEAARGAILALSTRTARDRSGRQRIAYRDLGVEQLGAVYETLLDYEPRRSHHTVTLQTGSAIRKSTGSFYTPQPIADYLVRRTLGPLVGNASADRLLRLRIVDPAMGSGAFLVAACRHLAGAYEAALVREGRCHANDVGESDRASMRRMIAERCLYGVDVNPMAVQLARLSLWLATLAADRPLSFLDHRLQAGDSLLGAWLSNLRAAPRGRRRTRHGRDDMSLFGDESVRGALAQALPVRFSLESMPNDTLDQVRAKERAFAALTARDAALSRWKQVADVWCAVWFAKTAIPPAAFSAVSDAIVSGKSALPARTADEYRSCAAEVAAARRFFHWELEFPEVFFDRDGTPLPQRGFDAVIGNPPWEMLRADTGPSDARLRSRDDLAGMLRFARESGLYASQTSGHANRYQLFVERALDLTRAGGRIGLVLPSGLATDHGSAALRRRLFTQSTVDSIVGIDNHRGVFPIHRSVRFLLVTATCGAPTESIPCRFGLDDPSQLEAISDETDGGAVTISMPLLERVSGPGLAIPAVREATDLALLERAAALFPPLGSTQGWAATFGRELNATDDCEWFHRVETHPRRRGCLPVVEGKYLEPFRVALDASTHTMSAADARRRLRSRAFEAPRLAYRDVASATNRQTLIAAVLPSSCVSTHTVFCLRTPLPLRAQHFLCGLFNSFVVNYLVRLRVTTHVTTATVERLPVPPPETSPRAMRDIAALARLLSRRRSAELLSQLNARVAELYQLSVEEFNHVLDTFPLVEAGERERALRLFMSAAK